MALYLVYHDDELVPEYVRASATAFPVEEQRINHERHNTDQARALSDAIRYRGPTGSPHFQEWVDALLHMRGRADAPTIMLAGDQIPASTILSAWWQDFEPDYEIAENISYRKIRIALSGQEATETSILKEMYAEDRNRASSAGISRMIEHLLSLQSLQRIDEVDKILSEATVAALAPEFLVGLLRINFPLRRQLKSWNRYHDKVEAELAARNIPDPQKILRGLRAR